MSQLTFPPLPYEKNALEPHISAETLEYHHGKHHKTYFDTLLTLIEGTDYAGLELDEIIKKSAKAKDGSPKDTKIFNNAAQVWNHTFYWNCMTPENGGGQPTGPIADKIKAAFGSYDAFKEQFITACKEQFGSGWAWLVADEVNGNVSIIKTSNAEDPLPLGKVAVLTCDVWEHAYYIDYRNRRPDYATTFVDKLINWEYVNAKLEGRDAGVEK